MSSLADLVLSSMTEQMRRQMAAFEDAQAERGAQCK